MKNRTKVLLGTAAAGVAAVAAVAGRAYALFSSSLDRNKRRPAPAEEGEDSQSPFQILDREGRSWAWAHKDICSRIVINSYGCELVGYYYDQSGDKTVIMVHGMGGDYTARLKDGGFYFNRGYNVLSVNLRCYGESDGRYCTMGSWESKDLVNWARYLVREKQISYIILDGVSMGGASVLAAGGDERLPKEVKGIVADCAYTSAEDIFRHQIQGQHRILASAILPFSRLFCRKLAGFSLKERTPLEAVKKARVPILFIHGTKDEVVPYSMVDELYEACKGPKKIFRAEGAAHALSCVKRSKEYAAALSEFLDGLETGK